ncbi:unnamed protein product [Fraxinus pennsylvanica]|uniref:CID domain-containing protein n=1 Tax=Fraxinus pennsylvanica TaxID=56036 RepID=A0AAD1ZX53_9LAMI|nr:unnamed protein product [Fraxinus pennsylvanica]
MNNAKQVVETWDRQFHCSPYEQRLAFLYLANDIIQNSRRKGAEFVTEFWKVLSDALREVIKHGDEFGKNAAFRLISIWEERKVFGSRGQILKEEFVKNQLNNDNKNGKHVGFEMKPTARNTLDKLVSGYQVVYCGQLDEDAVLNNCSNGISSIEKTIRDIGSDYGTGMMEQVKREISAMKMMKHPNIVELHEPYPIPQYMPTAGLVPNVPYGYNTSQHRAPLPGYPPVGPPMNGVSPLGVHPSSAYQMYPTEGEILVNKGSVKRFMELYSPFPIRSSLSSLRVVWHAYIIRYCAL